MEPSVAMTVEVGEDEKPGHNSMETTFLIGMIHNLLPAPARLHHMKAKGTETPHCQLCDSILLADLTHCLVNCLFNIELLAWLVIKPEHQVPGLLGNQVVHL